MKHPPKPRARLNENQVLQIFKSKADTLSSAKIAKTHRVSEKTVRDIWTGRTWSTETCHLDPSRTLQLKQTGRPKGCRDSRPRKRRISGKRHSESQSLLLTGSSYDSEGSSDWHRSDPSLSYNTGHSQHPTMRCGSVDDQLHDWDAFWSSAHAADPFRGDWTPRPLEYHA
jgi:hypothetical protein